MNAFLTGSRVYGVPHAQSDYDLVIRADDKCLMDQPGLADLLRSAADIQPTEEGYVGSEHICLRFGALNLLICCSDRAYEAWRKGTDELIKRRPVTRDEAIEVMKCFRTEAGLEPEVLNLFEE